MTECAQGIVAKRLNSRYRPGARSPDWIKIKNVRTLDAVVGGWVPGHGRLEGLPGAVLLREHHEGRLRYIGSVGIGWSDRERRQLAALLTAAVRPDCPFDHDPAAPGARWVLPRLVAEITYTTRTAPDTCAIPPGTGSARTSPPTAFREPDRPPGVAPRPRASSRRRAAPRTRPGATGSRSATRTEDIQHRAVRVEDFRHKLLLVWIREALLPTSSCPFQGLFRDFQRCLRDFRGTFR